MKNEQTEYLDPCGVVLPGDEWEWRHRAIGKCTGEVSTVAGQTVYFVGSTNEWYDVILGKEKSDMVTNYRLLSRPGLPHGGVVKVGDKWQNLNSGIVREVVKLGNFQGENGPWKSAIATFETGTWLFRRELTDNDHWVLIHREPEATLSPEAQERWHGLLEHAEQVFQDVEAMRLRHLSALEYKNARYRRELFDLRRKRVEDKAKNRRLRSLVHDLRDSAKDAKERLEQCQTSLDAVRQCWKAEIDTKWKLFDKAKENDAAAKLSERRRKNAQINGVMALTGWLFGLGWLFAWLVS